MKTTRKSIFETNSSSSHSITISDSCENWDNISPDENGNIILNGGEFGWEVNKYSDALTKANYCAVDCINNEDEIELLEEVIKEYTLCDNVVINFDLSYDSTNWSYIDHQSQGASKDAFISKELLKNFIFNKNSILITGNDN